MSGVDQGEFTVYIIIRAKFAESICSINAAPSCFSLKYAMNMKL